jgi:hypothetical protein
MDYSFLQIVTKTKDDGFDKLTKLEKGGKSTSSRRTARKATVKAALKRAAEGGVGVRMLPGWMERAGLNRTRWSGKEGRLYWTVEWIVRRGKQRERFLDTKSGDCESAADCRVHDEKTLKEAFKEHQSDGHEEIQFLMRKAEQPVLCYEASANHRRTPPFIFAWTQTSLSRRT